MPSYFSSISFRPCWNMLNIWMFAIFWDTLCDMVHDMLDEISQQKIRKERGKVPSFQKAKLLPPSTKVSGTQKRIQKVRRSIHELVMKVAHWKPLHPTFLELTQKTVYNINQYLLSFGCPVVEPDMTIQGLQEFILSTHPVRSDDIRRRR